MHVSCRTCRWSQDDFWSEFYSPFTVLETARADFLRALTLPSADRTERVDVGHLRTHQVPATPNPDGGYAVPVAAILAARLEELGGRVRRMRWWTHADYLADPHPTCPVCASPDLSLD